VTTGTKEGTQVASVNISIVVLVDRSVSRKSGVVESDFEFASQAVASTGEIDFLLQNLNSCRLNITRQRVESGNSAAVRSVQGNATEQVVLARQKKLQEILE